MTNSPVVSTNNESSKLSTNLVRVLLSLVVLIFLTIGGYSAYRIYSQRTKISENNLVTPTPTGNEIATINTGTSPTPEATVPTVSPNLNISPTIASTPTLANPTKTPTVVVTITPTKTPTVKITASPTIQPSVTPTKTPAENLPVAGSSIPTIFLFSLGLILILPILLL